MSGDETGCGVVGPVETGDQGSLTRTSFDEVYDQPDPRMFFQTFVPWEYQTPHHAQRVFRRLVAAREASVVVDVCCSYGINAALLNHELTLADLYAHYTSPEVTDLTTEELIEVDQAFYAGRRRPDPTRVIGIDVAANAVTYARAVGLLDAGFAENLETAPPSPGLLTAVRPAELITITGGTSFLTARTFQALLDAATGAPWVVAFVLRTNSHAVITEALAGYDLVTEVSASTVRQRRFTSEHERRYAVNAVIASGADPEGRETDGYYHAVVHLSRPASEINNPPSATLLDQ